MTTMWKPCGSHVQHRPMGSFWLSEPARYVIQPHGSHGTMCSHIQRAHTHLFVCSQPHGMWLRAAMWACTFPLALCTTLQNCGKADSIVAMTMRKLGCDITRHYMFSERNSVRQRFHTSVFAKLP